MTIPRDPPHLIKPIVRQTNVSDFYALAVRGQDQRLMGSWAEHWCAGALARTWLTSRKRERRYATDTDTDASALWGRFCEGLPVNGRTVVWTRDLGRTLRVAQALVHLPAAGWDVAAIVLERTASWCVMRAGKASLIFADVNAWGAGSDGALRAAHDHGRAYWPDPLPDTAEGPEGALQDAVGVGRVALALHEWLRAEGLGPWRPTGSGQSYVAWRKRWLTHRPLVHDNLPLLEREREAMWTGRCEAWRHGRQRFAGAVEVDMRAAYCQIAAQCDLPLQPAGERVHATLEQLLGQSDRYAVLADVTVESEQPLVPARLGERIAWPVGRWRGTYWCPELQVLSEAGAGVQVHRAWLYRKAPVLRAFASWVLEQLDGVRAGHGQVAHYALKHWSRCLVGRLGLRYRAWEPFGTTAEPGLLLTTLCDYDTGEHTDLLWCGHKRMVLSAMQEAPASVPSIPGWIMSECRRRLWAAMRWAGPERLLYVDTDSMIYADATIRPRDVGRPWTVDRAWTVRGVYDAITIHGPRNLTTGDLARVSGVPLSARRTGPLEFDGRISRSLRESMRTGQLDAVHHLSRTWRLSGLDLRRDHQPDGSTVPYRLEHDGVQQAFR